MKSWEVKEYRILDLPEHDIEKMVYKRPIPPKADIVFCLEVFEYLIDPVVALKNIKSLMNEGGKAYITFAFVYPMHEELELDSLRYTETGIVRLAECVGLEVSNITYRTDRSGLLQSFYSIDGMHPSKRYAHHDATGFIVEFTND